MSDLTETERAILLEPCTCGHTINDHGSLIACWVCGEDGGDCKTDFEDLLVERVDQIVAARLAEAAAETAAEPTMGDAP